MKRTLLAIAAIAAATNYYPPVFDNGPRIPRDPFKPNTRHRKVKASPAQRLIENQRKKRAKATT